MAKRNKIRYRSRPKEKPRLALTGRVFLRYEDEEAIAGAQKGDLLLYPCNDALNSTRLGEYRATGFSGYFKADVHDGRDWRPVIIHSIFPGQQNHFAKKERPWDTYRLCAETLADLAGKILTRSYREHYSLEEEEEEGAD